MVDKAKVYMSQYGALNIATGSMIIQNPQMSSKVINSKHGIVDSIGCALYHAYRCLELSAVYHAYSCLELSVSHIQLSRTQCITHTVV